MREHTPIEFAFADEIPPAEPTQHPKLSRVADGKRWVELPARDQMTFLVRRTEDLVPADALVRDVAAIMELLDYLPFEVKYSGGGRPTWHPSFLCTILVYASSLGIQSAREISRRLERDTHFMWLAREQRIDHETLSDFRRNFHSELHQLFKQTVTLAMDLGLVDMAFVAIDGTKIAACAGRSTMSAVELDKALAKVDEAIDKVLSDAEAADSAEDAELGDRRDPCPGEVAPADQTGAEIDGPAQPAAQAKDKPARRLARLQRRRDKLLTAKKQLDSSDAERVSLNDPEAPVMKTMGGKRPGYNGQIAVDKLNGIAVSESLTTDQNDTQQFEPVTKQAIANAGQVPGCLVGDSGYQSEEALKYLASREDLNAYIRQQKLPDQERYSRDDFTYDEATDTLTCPAGRCLTYCGDKKLRDRMLRYYSPRETCADCELRDNCIKPGAKDAKRSVLLVPHHALVTAMRQKTQTPAGEQVFKDRSSTVERVFGTMKSVLGLTQFKGCGPDNAASQFTLTITAYNIRRILTCLGSQAVERLLAARQSG